jgi:glycerophosphoryl diester phosphodiesterase
MGSSRAGRPDSEEALCRLSVGGHAYKGGLAEISGEPSGLDVTRVFAHRGSAHDSIENTVAAFIDARRLGADGIELDVRRSADGAFVIHHDARIDGFGSISDCAVVELPQHIPLLSEVLEICEGMAINVEIKNGVGEPGFDPSRVFAAHVVEEALSLAQDSEIIISSFDLASLQMARATDAGVQIGLLTGLGADLSAALLEVVEQGFQAIHPFVLDVTEPFVAAAHAEGIVVNTWTVNAAHDLARMRDFGVDAVISDDVALARSIVDLVP